MSSRSSRLVLTATAATAATATVLGAAGPASAEILPEDLGVGTLPIVADSTAITTGSAMSALNPALDLQLDPLANTTTDPLSNSVGTQVADFQPVSTAAVTGPLANGASARDLVGGLLGGLPLSLS